MVFPQFNLGQDVRKFCAQIGADPLLVQGAGGNASWKEGHILWIKASGTGLADAERQDIFVPVDLAELDVAISKRDFSAIPKIIGESKLKPSIETLLHALMPHRVVVHLHAIEVLAHLVRPDFSGCLKNLLGDVFSFAEVKYSKPGCELATEIHLVLERHPSVDVIFLMNHGVVIGGESVTEIRQLLLKIIEALATEPLIKNAEYSVEPSKGVLSQYALVADAGIQQLALAPTLFKRLRTDWALYPDHIVFLGPEAHAYPSWTILADQDISALPELVFIYGEGVYAKSSFTPAKQAQLRCYFDVLIRQKPENILSKLTTNDIAELLNWDAEKYRMSLAK